MRSICRFRSAAASAFGGYDLKNFVEPKLKRTAPNDLELPDSWVGFFSSLVVFDHWLDKVWIIATGLGEDGSRAASRTEREIAVWKDCLSANPPQVDRSSNRRSSAIQSTSSKQDFVEMVRVAQEYIRLGHIYQVNLSHRLCADWPNDGWELFSRLREVSPAPYAAYLHCGEFELCSSSPEMFLRMSGAHIQTRPIKGTRPRSADANRDAQLSYELQTSAKELSELL
jgi:para-aminobenzoate synthetase component 1